MGMSEQEKVLIVQKAKEYVQAESEASFKKEVVDALDEHAYEELYDRFYASLSFGTAGMRGVIGAAEQDQSVHGPQGDPRTCDI